jgi:hypothetical protein
MKRTMLSLLMILAPLPVMAQEPATSADRHQDPYAIVSDLKAPERQGPKADDQQPTPAPRPVAPTIRRRSGSKVGYVEDAVISSKVRVRFDAGFQNTVPDRAEFFYGKCGCYGGDAPGPQPGSAKDLDFQQLTILGEYAVNDRFSVFGHVPVRWIQPQDFIQATLGGQTGFSSQSGFSDLRAGAKAGLVATDEQSVTIQAQFYFPTGKASKGLGTDHASFEPALLYYQQLSEVVVLESQIGMWFPIGGSSGAGATPDEDFSGKVFYYGIGPSFAVYKSERVRIAPVIELVGWRVLNGMQTLEGPPASPVNPALAEGTNIVNLKFGARFDIDRGSFYVGYGHALTDATWYEDILRFEYRFSF